MGTLVACYIFSLMILCLAGAFWLRALRIERSAKSMVERMRTNLNVSKGSQNARKRMWLREMRQKVRKGWQGRDIDNRFRPSPPDASQKGRIEKVQQAIRKRREALLRAYNGGRK
jgi:hypothetical protein